MPKVKMSDVKSGSISVKNLFKIPMSSRIMALKKFTFTNRELIEILEISEDIENHSDKRRFYQQLIQSQKGPFNSNVFKWYIDKLFDINSLLHLIDHAENLSIDDKLSWLNYMMVTSANWSVFNFFSKNMGLEYGIDVTQNPFRAIYSDLLVRYIQRAGFNNSISKDYYNEVNRILDQMSESELYEWYTTSIQSSYVKKVISIIMNYPKMPSKIIVEYYEKISAADGKDELIKHPNMISEIKLAKFAETGREEYLPQTAKDVFLF